ncbi:MAG: diaminopimelate decarboxylase, partial [Gammaproteobacteria bacterium]
MDPFHTRDGQLYAEGVALTDIARELGTPCYVYSRAAIEGQWHAFDQAFAEVPHLICYAVKANSSLA